MANHSDEKKVMIPSNTVSKLLNKYENISSIEKKINLKSLSLPISAEQSMGLKYKSIGANSGWTTVMSYNGSGTITKFWLAVAGSNGNNLFLNISYDGVSVPQFGGNSPTPSNDPLNGNYNSIGVGDFLSPGFSGTGTCITETFGITNDANSTYCGYICLDMPFTTGFQIQLNNTSPNCVIYYMQAFYNTTPPNTPLRLYCTPFVYLNCSYPNEYPFISQTSPNGVFLKATKLFYYGNTQGTNTFEGRFKFYSGGTGMSSPINANHYTDSTNQIPTPYQTNANVLSWSTGTEDYVLNSYDFRNFSIPAVTKYGGILYLSNLPTNNYNWSLIKIYDTQQGLLQSSPNNYLVGSWSCGDIIGGPTGNVGCFWGYSFYYA